MNKSKHLLLMGGYRQWRTPKILDQYNDSNTYTKQNDRLTNILNKWTTAVNENKDMICMMDDNIDTNNTNNNNNNKKLLLTLNDHLSTNNITRLNCDNTRFVASQKPSSIDHIYTNNPNKTTNMQTHSDMITDHKLLSIKFNTNEQIYHPKFVQTRDRKRLNTQL